MNVVVAHPGVQHSFQLALELQKRSALAAFYTGLAFSTDGFVERVWRMLPSQWQRSLVRRRITGIPPALLHCRPVGELVALWRTRRGAEIQKVMQCRNERFQRSIPEEALSSATAVIGFDTAAWILSNRCAARAIPFVLDQSTPHPDAKSSAYELVRQQYPEWNINAEVRRREVRDVEQKEHDSASMVVAGSSFVKHTLIERGVSAAKIRVNPYGVDCSRFHAASHHDSRPFRFVFVGAINGRKGVPLLIDAWRQLSGKGAELWLIGGGSENALKQIPDLPGLRCLGRVTRDDVAKAMQQCDVFVFPTYFEGLALVILEAMACGLPVITTFASGAEGVISEGDDGWLLERGDLAGLIEKMNYCLENRHLTREMGRRARTTAERFTWSAYGDRWIKILLELCG